jgi:hypothetical protein
VRHGGFPSALEKAELYLLRHFVTFAGSGVTPFEASFDSRLRRHAAFLPAAFIFEPAHLFWAAAGPALMNAKAMTAKDVATTLPIM